MNDPSGKLDILDTHPSASQSPRDPRPHLNVLFDCCGVYLRIYRSADGRSYRGHCPRCGRPVTFAVGPGGTSARFFRVS
jgi:hypothetical protein